MASNKNFDFRKIENFARSKLCYPKEYQKIKETKLISENLVRTLKLLMGISHTKGKKGDT